MKFIDEAIIEVKAGDGGNGCVSFRREKFVPKGGPNGGDGGDGGSCILETQSGLTTLMDLTYRKRFQAKNGIHGKGKNMFGKKGEDCVIFVPIGCVVKDAQTQKLLADLNQEGQKIVVAKGGKGGLGNSHFVSSTNQAPRKATQGTEGEDCRIHLELKLLADVGLIGFPNAGKSTLISAISNAKPKIAAYPFTTTLPHLGVVRLDRERNFVVADIPGLIEGAHQGSGLGIQFLKHIERTKVLLHLIDITDASHSDPIRAYENLRLELRTYDTKLAQKPEVVVLTKMDLTETKDQKDAVEKEFLKRGLKVFSISAVKRENVKTLLEHVSQILALSEC